MYLLVSLSSVRSAVVKFERVDTVPVTLPVTLPVRGPLNVPAVIVPVIVTLPDPSFDTSVPDVGRVTLVLAVLTNVVGKLPLVVKLFASVRLPVRLIVRSAFLTFRVSVLSAVKGVVTLLDARIVLYVVAFASLKLNVEIFVIEPGPVMVGVVIAGDVSVLFVKVSTPPVDTRVAPLTAALSWLNVACKVLLVRLNVLFVSVCVEVRVAIELESTLRITSLACPLPTTVIPPPSVIVLM